MDRFNHYSTEKKILNHDRELFQNILISDLIIVLFTQNGFQPSTKMFFLIDFHELSWFYQSNSMILDHFRSISSGLMIYRLHHFTMILNLLIHSIITYNRFLFKHRFIWWVYDGLLGWSSNSCGIYQRSTQYHAKTNIWTIHI